MRRNGRGGCVLGFISIAVGVLIILAMIVPSGFWWFAVGLALIIGGVCMLRAF